MALVDCGECGREISDQAEACPQCGAPRQKTKTVVTKEAARKGGIYEFIGFVVIVGSIGGCIAGYESGGTILAAIGFTVFLAGRFM